MHPSKTSSRISRSVNIGLPKRMFIGVIIFAIILIIAVSVFMLQAVTRDNSPMKVIYVPLLSSGHLKPGERPPAYNSDPPTSGLHEPVTASWGSYSANIPDEVVLHNLEHGGIWLSYNDLGDTDAIAILKDITKRYSTQVILTYRPRDDSRIIIAAWGKLLKLDAPDVIQIEEFIRRYRYKGPENG